MVAPVVATVPAPAAERREPEALEFPGCHPVRIPRDQIDDDEIRIEYWDADTEIAMICDPPVSYYHERPASRLASLARLIAAARGAPIEAAGHTDLLVRNPRGERQRIMQADQILFLRPAQTKPAGNAVEVGTDALPDVVLEVDNTEVPERLQPSRPASLRPGLTIHVREGREGGGFRTSAASLAFPRWTAAEIHRALNEPELSGETAEVLNRVGRELGSAEGTSPDDDPFLRRQRAEGRAEAQRGNALKVLQARGVAVSASRFKLLAAMPGVAERLMDAALACRDEAEFLRLASAE